MFALLRHDCFNVLTNTDFVAFILTGRMFMFVYRTLGLVV